MAVLSGVCGSTGPGGRASVETIYNKSQHNIPRITVKQTKLRVSKEHKRQENAERWQPARQITASKSFKDTYSIRDGRGLMNPSVFFLYVSH